MEVIFIRLDPEDKKKLTEKAKLIGLNLTAYCRMILLKSLKED